MLGLLDRFAREGMRFEDACVTNSICTPRRATVLTGKYSRANGRRSAGRHVPRPALYSARNAASCRIQVPLPSGALAL